MALSLIPVLILYVFHWFRLPNFSSVVLSLKYIDVGDVGDGGLENFNRVKLIRMRAKSGYDLHKLGLCSAKLSTNIGKCCLKNWIKIN